MKKKTVFLLFISIWIQTMLAITAGFFVLSLLSNDRISPNVFVEGAAIGDMRKADAVKKLEEYYGQLLKEEQVRIFIKDKPYGIKFAELDVSVDCAATVQSACGIKGGGYLFNLVGMYFYPARRIVTPVVRADGEKLREKLEEIALLTDRNPVNADISIEGGRIVKKPEEYGLRLDIDRAARIVMDGFGRGTSVSVRFQASDDGVMQTVKPGITFIDLEGIDEVISEYTTPIADMNHAAAVKEAADAIHKVLLQPGDEARGILAGEFSFNQCLILGKGIKMEDDVGYSQVASTLYTAVLAAGIEQSGISRTPCRTRVPYIEPGLDAQVRSGSVDFRFFNTLKSKLGVFAEVKDDRLTVRIGGKKKEPSTRYEIKTDTVQRFTPSVISVESPDLKRGRKKVLDPGVEGVRVAVYRITLRGGVKIREEHISTDTYDAIHSIVQIGPGTEWRTGSDK